MRRVLLAILLAGALASGSVPQTAPGDAPAESTGHVGLGLMLRRLSTTGVFMMATAHPDDENNGLLAMLTLGQGIRTTLATATRGDGGQNEIGPELFDALAVLRTEELLSAHRFDAAEQYFTRAVDFGYSFSIEETFKLWGREEILGDYVRLIRMIRPDVIAGLRPDGAGGGQHHQASAVLAREAFRAAADPNRFPEQIKEGLRPWQPAKFYFAGGFGFPGETPPAGASNMLTIALGGYDPLLGRTYAEIGSEARSMHKCQGTGQLLLLPAPSRGRPAGPGGPGGMGFFRGDVARYYLADSTLPESAARDASLFGGIDASVAGLARYAGPNPPPTLVAGLAAIAREAQAAQQAFARGGAAATVQPLAAGLGAVHKLRRDIGAIANERARAEIDDRLLAKQRQFQQALLLASGIRLDAIADDGLVIGNQMVGVTVLAANRGQAPLDVGAVAFAGFGGGDARHEACAAETVKPGDAYACSVKLQVPAGARLTAPYFRQLPDAARYVFEPDAPFGAPFRPTPFLGRVRLEIAGVAMDVDLPIQYRYEGNIFSGEKRMEVTVVPAFSVRVTPEIAIVPTRATESASLKTGPTGEGAAPAPASLKARPAGEGEGETDREVRVTVVNGAKGAATATVALRLPQGWAASPASAPATFAREDESVTVRFKVTPPRNVAPGEYPVDALVSADGATFTQGYQVIEYPHTRRRHVLHPARTRLKAIDVKVAPNINVGYLVGVGDEVPAAIEQLGARLEVIDPDALAWGDLSKFDVIVTGVRAYEKRADLRANNHRLLSYVEQGGTLLVQYNKFEFNEAQYGPYPAKVSSNRITDEHTPVQPLVADHPIFSVPNRITERTWTGWVQERGLYFLGEKDARYVDLVQMEDPLSYNRGAKRGALVEARYGKGRWMYVGLGLWRQLPAGTDGAYQLLANLISSRP